MTTILVSGANGQLGVSMKDISTNSPHLNFIFLSRNQLDITDFNSLKFQFELHQPDFFINTAAYTAVDKAEIESNAALLVNGTSLKYIGEICDQYNTKVIHISSDYVYHSDKNGLLTENSPTQPKSIYAKSKLLGEQELLDKNAESLILRTSWVYSEHGNNFVKTMIRLSKDRDELSIVNDQIGAPTYAMDIATTIIQIIEKTVQENKRWNGQIYNFCNAEFTTWYSFADFIFNEMEISMTLHPIPTSSYPTPAARPQNSRLNTSKIIMDWDIKIRPWQDACREMLAVLKLNIDGTK